MQDGQPRSRLDIALTVSLLLGLALWILAQAGVFDGVLGLAADLLERANRSRPRPMDALVDSSSAYLAGTLLVAGAGLIAVWLARWHIQHSPRWTQRSCPRCWGDVVRVHRKPIHRLLGVLLWLPIHRYRCRNPLCGWTGLLLGRSHRRRVP